MEKTDLLIRTKLRPPFIRPGLVPRVRLQEKIKLGLHGPLTLIIAPAGFGKTTLVASCVIGSGNQVAWLSLDKNDNRPGRFLTYLAAALQEVDPTIGSDAAQLLATSQHALPEVVLTSLINDLEAGSSEIALALDDYQFINSQAVHDGVTFLLEHCPRTFHLVIASRSDPPLPLARLRARAQTVELRAADLRFTQTEAAWFLNDVMGLQLDSRSVEVLEERTEGWIAGLQMASLALQGPLTMRDHDGARAFIEAFSGTNRFILDYLLEEVLANQPPEIQHFLQYTSILERLTAPLCDALMGIDGQPETRGSDGRSASILATLERENLFLVSLDQSAAGGAGATWFRYHHLFGDLLRARLHQAQPDFVARLHQRASDWLEKNSYIPEAIQHLLDAQEYGGAADLIERYGPSHWSENDLSVVQMADSLPYEILLERPKIGLYQAWLFINQGNIEKGLPLLLDMASRLDGAVSDPGQQWIATIVHLALNFLGNRNIPPGAAGLPAVTELDQIPADEMVMRDAAEILYAMTLGRRGETDQAVQFSLKCIERDRLPGRVYRRGAPNVPTLVPFLATMYLFQGRLHEAAALCRQYLDLIKTKSIRISTAGNLDVVLGDVLCHWNRLDEAEQHIRDGLRANEPWGNIMTDSFGLLALVNVLRAKGEYAEAMQVVEKFETKLHSQTRPIEFGEPFFTLRVSVQLASGNLQYASNWADQVHLSQEFRQHEDYFRLILARIRLAQARYAEAEDILNRIAPLLEVGNRVIRQIESNLLMASAVAGQQRMPEALGFIESSLALAEPEGYIQVFLDAGEAVRDLLSAYIRSVSPRHKLFAQKVLGAFSPSARMRPTVQTPYALVEPLSERELEVLKLMALGRTNQEIARQLIVARGTIKAHAASIYRKLDAANRTEAVARARQLGLIA